MAEQRDQEWLNKFKAASDEYLKICKTMGEQRNQKRFNKLEAFHAEHLTRIYSTMGEQGDQELHTAVRNRDITLVEKILDSGALIDIQNAEGNTPLHLAVSMSDRSMVTTLLSRGASILIVNKKGENPLDLSSCESLCGLLIDKTQIKPTRIELKVLLHKAVRSNQRAIVSVILDRGVTVDLKNNHGGTPLHIAAQSDLSVSMIDLLLDRGANIEALDKFGKTPLNYASATESKKCIERLINRGANTNIEYGNQNTPLHSLVSMNKLTSVDCLLETGFFVDVRNNEGLTPLHVAASYLHCNMAVKLIDQGADINAKNNNGETPLHCAVGQTERPYAMNDFVDILIERGADIEAKTNLGDTPLHLASESGNSSVVNQLLCARADSNALNDNDQTPYELAEDELVKQNFTIQIYKLSLVGLAKNPCFENRENILLTSMRNAIITEFFRITKTIVHENVSLNIIFIKHRNPSHYLSNHELVLAIEDKLEKSNSEFFHFGSILRNTFEKSKKAFHIQNFSNHVLANHLFISENMPLPQLIVEKISQYLDVSTRYQLVRIGVFSDFQEP